MNSGGLEEHYRDFLAIFAHFWPIFTYFEENIPSESAKTCLFKQVHLFSIIRYITFWSPKIKAWPHLSISYRKQNRSELKLCWKYSTYRVNFQIQPSKFSEITQRREEGIGTTFARTWIRKKGHIQMAKMDKLYGLLECVSSVFIIIFM